MVAEHFKLIPRSSSSLNAATIFLSATWGLIPLLRCLNWISKANSRIRFVDIWPFPHIYPSPQVDRNTRCRTWSIDCGITWLRLWLGLEPPSELCHFFTFCCYGFFFSALVYMMITSDRLHLSSTGFSMACTISVFRSGLFIVSFTAIYATASALVSLRLSPSPQVVDLSVHWLNRGDHNNIEQCLRTPVPTNWGLLKPFK